MMDDYHDWVEKDLVPALKKGGSTRYGYGCRE